MPTDDNPIPTIPTCPVCRSPLDAEHDRREPTCTYKTRVHWPRGNAELYSDDGLDDYAWNDQATERSGDATPRNPAQPPRERRHDPDGDPA